AIHNQLDTLSINNVDSVQGSNDAKVDVDFNPTAAANTLRVPLEREVKETEEQYFYFPWATDGIFVDSNLWQALLGIGKERRGWLSDTHLALWVLYYGIIDRQKLIRQLLTIFNTFMLSNKLPCCYADGVTYGVPWFAQYVKKVYFPINVEEIHWIVAELHIRSGVVTFYDSLPLKDLHVEDRIWWLGMRESYACQIPKLMLDTEVLKKKNIDPTNYSISYRYAINVPRQGDAYGDCGIWVMRNLYRLVNNLSLKVSNPTQLGLAYREQLIAFFWKYKIPLKNE
nr:ulp1 protease family, C-terminal catalytic domain-containing protein [Tanacetum cinerariifolium]